MATPIRGPADFLELGDWNAICAECGGKAKASTMMRLPPGVPGAGMYVHSYHWTPRQIQDFVKSTKDNMAPPWTQPAVVDTFAITIPLETEASNDIVGDLDFLLTENGQFIYTET